MTSDDEQKAIEEAFVKSWDVREEYYKNLIADGNWDWLKPVLVLVKELRERGYDHKLLVARWWHILVLARSVDRELRSAQSALCFRFRRNGNMKIQYWENPDTKEEFDTEQITLTPEIEALLTRLLAQPID